MPRTNAICTASRAATARIADVSRNTVSKLIVDAGKVCAKYQDEALRELTCQRVQVDEGMVVYLRQGQERAASEKRAARSWRRLDMGCHRRRHEARSMLADRAWGIWTAWSIWTATCGTAGTAIRARLYGQD